MRGIYLNVVRKLEWRGPNSVKHISKSFIFPNDRQRCILHWCEDFSASFSTRGPLVCCFSLQPFYTHSLSSHHFVCVCMCGVCDCSPLLWKIPHQTLWETTRNKWNDSEPCFIYLAQNPNYSSQISGSTSFVAVFVRRSRYYECYEFRLCLWLRRGFMCRETTRRIPYYSSFHVVFLWPVFWKME